MAGARSDGRLRGRIEERGSSLRVVVYAGVDPVTSKRVYLRESVKGTDKAAYKRAEKVMNRLLTKVEDQRSPTSSVTLAYAVDEWLRTSEVEDSTRDGYVNYINRYIKPILGEQSVRKIDAHTLESFYTELRRCRVRCDGKPFIEKHKAADEHDCAELNARSTSASRWQSQRSDRSIRSSAARWQPRNAGAGSTPIQRA